MTSHDRPSLDVQEFWRGQGANGWIQAQSLLDQMFRPHTDVLMQAIRREHPIRLLDVGCGTGATTVAASQSLPPGSSCVGVDIAPAMIDAARMRATEAATTTRFLCADAEYHAFESAHFDLLISRFGIMFFADPARAFTNLRRAMRAQGQLIAIAWRSEADNPFMLTAERAARPYLPNLAPRTAGSPGQFGLARASRTRTLLGSAGWIDVDIRPLDLMCEFPAARLHHYLMHLGPVGRALQHCDSAQQQRIINAIAPAFETYRSDDTITFTAACWLIQASAP